MSEASDTDKERKRLEEQIKRHRIGAEKAIQQLAQLQSK